MMMMRRCALVLLVLQAGRTSCDSPDVSTGMGLPARLRGGAGARSRETRQEMNQRWRREARERAERQAAEEAAEERASAAGGGDDGAAPAPPPAPERRDPAAGVVLLSKAGEPETAPRARLLAALCARQQCNALDPSLYNMQAAGEDASKYSSMSDYIEWTRHHKSTDEDVGIVAYATRGNGVGGLLKVDHGPAASSSSRACHLARTRRALRADRELGVVGFYGPPGDSGEVCLWAGALGRFLRAGDSAERPLAGQRHRYRTGAAAALAAARRARSD